MQALILLAIAMGVLFSPESLILLGNSTGSTGWLFLGLVIAAGLAALGMAGSFGVVNTRAPAVTGEARYLHAAFGAMAAIVFPICGRVVFLVCASTGILAIAGYVFNEVFVYWFPNLGFSFYLLGFLLLLNLLGPRVAAVAQVLFVAIALAGLVGLTVVGLLGWGQAPVTVDMTNGTPLQLSRVVFAAFVLFVGFDLAVFTPRYREDFHGYAGKYMAGGIALAALVFCLWAVVSAAYVPAAKLAGTTVPHMVAARALLGQNGRVIMGVVVLAGTCSAVNALLLGGAQMLTHMAVQGLLPSVLGWAPRRAPMPLLLLAAGPAAMMYSGMAGEPETEVFTRAGVIFWLLHYIAMQLAVLKMRRQMASGSSIVQRAYYPFLAVLSLGVLGVSCVGLVWFDSEPRHLLTFMLIVAGSVSILSLVWIIVRRGRLMPVTLGQG